MHTQNNNLDAIEFLFPSNLSLETLKKILPSRPFSDEIVGYLSELSRQLYKDSRVKHYPDVAAFAFFCRKANLAQLKLKFTDNKTFSLGRGIVFHVAPSNVPVNFAFSLISGLLSGNANIVRVSSTKFEQVDIIIDAIKNLSKCGSFKKISNNIVIVRYDRNSIGTDVLSSLSDVRIIWGGDETIKKIRESRLPATSFDITFPDRYSICIINADVYINDPNTEKIAQRFYNDTYLFDQNACTSPHAIIWLGKEDNVKKSQKIFWEGLYHIVKIKYTLQPVSAIDKITAFCNQAILQTGITRNATKDNYIWRVKLHKLDENLDKFKSSAGYFMEYHATDLNEISIIINRKYQTISYHGLEESTIYEFMNQNTPTGVYRIVPIGRTMEFSLNWDGHNLIQTLSRKIEML